VFSVSETEPPQILKKEKAKVKEGRVIPETQLVVVAAEEMFDKCMEAIIMSVKLVDLEWKLKPKNFIPTLVAA
jgi:hypothetical protein